MSRLTCKTCTKLYYSRSKIHHP